MDEETAHIKSRKEIRKEMEDAEKKYQGYLERRNEFNDKARVMREERDLLHEKRKEVMTRVNALREKKNKALNELRKHKERRNALHKRAHELIDLKRAKRGLKRRDSISMELGSLKDHLRKLEYRQETTPLSLEKERDIIDEIRKGYKVLKELEKECAEVEEVNEEIKTLNGQLDNLFKEADTEHELVVKYYESSREFQEKMDGIIKEVSHLITEADKKHEAFLEFRKKGDEFHQKAMEMRNHLNDIRKENRARYLEIKRLITEQNKAARQAVADKKKLKQKYEEAYDKLKSKKKISL